MGETDYLDTEAVARLLGLKPTSVRRYRLRPGSNFPEPDITLGGHPGWKKETIQAWAATRRGRGRPANNPPNPTPLNRPGMSGDSVPWEGWSHVREYVEEVPGRAA